MKILEEKRNEFTQLQIEILALKKEYGYDDGFASKEQLQRFIADNESILSRSNDLREEIEQLEWDLKSPEEQEKLKEQEKLSKLKREGKLYDYLTKKRGE